VRETCAASGSPDAPGRAARPAGPQTGVVIRDVVVGRLRAGADTAVLDEALQGLLGLPLEGLVEMHVGQDAGLAPGSWDYVITADFADADAYRAYDADEEHIRLRRELLDAVSEQIARVQFEIPDVQVQAHHEISGESSWVEPPPGERRRR
jgi:hypothetical protein